MTSIPPAGTAFVTGGSGFLGRSLIPYLIERGWKVKALGRSDAALQAVKALGAEPVRGDLDSVAQAGEALRGCDVIFHCAAWASDWGDEAEAWKANVVGTENMLQAAISAGVPRFVHVSTEAVLMDGHRPIVQADESWSLPEKPLGPYARTKGEAERRVAAAHARGLQTVVVRPRFIWGKGDTNVLPKLIEATRAGVLQWIGGGEYLTSTCHVTNVCEGMLKAAQKGQPGALYFLTDGPPVIFRKFISDLLETQGVTPPTRSVPRGLVHFFARVGDWAWRTLPLKGSPPLSHSAFFLMGNAVTVNDAKARRELGYEGSVSIAEGLRGLRA